MSAMLSLKNKIIDSFSTLVICLCAALLVQCSSRPKQVPSSAVAYREAIARTQGSSLTGPAFESMRDACNLGSQPACLAVGQLPFESVQRKLSILQGYTNATSTQLNVVARETDELEFNFWDIKKSQVLAPSDLQRVQRPGSSWVVYVLQYQNLSIDKPYRLDVISKGGDLIDSRYLQALSPELAKGRIAIASCMNDQHEPNNGKKIWMAMAATQPNMVLFIGDNIYADLGLPHGASPDHIWNRYVETRNNIEFYRWAKLVPTLATWDDHDFGKNDGDRNYPYKNEAASIFRLFFPQEPDGKNLKLGPGVSRVYRGFGQKIILLDDRTFRSPLKTPMPEQTLFGTDQEKWLLAELNADSSPAWLVNGFQFFGGYHSFESYEGSHLESFQKFVKQLRTIRRPLWFVSGDRHLAEMMEISSTELGVRSWELTTSGIQAHMYASRWNERANPRQISGVDQQLNFAIVDTQKTIQGAKLGVQVLGSEGQKLFSRDVELKR